MQRVNGTFRDVRFEIAFEGDESHFIRFEVPSGSLCKCSRDLLVSSVLGKPLRSLSLDAVAFALGTGYEGFPEEVRRCLMIADRTGRNTGG